MIMLKVAACMLVVFVTSSISSTIDPFDGFTQATAGCGAADIYFIWDGSGSVTNSQFEQMKQFTINVVKNLPTASGETKVGLIQYSSNHQVEWNLNNQPANLESAFQNVTQIGGGTNTAGVLDAVYNMLQTGYNRPNYKDVVIFITDANSGQSQTIPNAERLHNVSVEVFAIGVGSFDDSELTGIASLPKATHKYVVTDYTSLTQISTAVTQGACLVFNPETTDHCAPSPCQNSGTCTNANSGYTCTCPLGYTGVKCESDIDYCRNSPCLNDGTCTNQPGGYKCQCAPGYTGDNCETDLCTNCKIGSDGVGYLSYSYNCAIYIQCEKRTDGTYSKHFRQCPRGLYWNPNLLTCSRTASPGCTEVEPTTGTSSPIYVAGPCTLSAVIDEPKAFTSNGIKQYCGPRTVFDAAQCSCVIDLSTVPVVNQCDELYYLPFDSTVEDKSCTKVWVGSHFARGWTNVNTHITQTGCVKGGCMFFNGITRLSIPHMSNRWNNKNLKNFTMAVWVKRTSGNHLAGVVNNGDCVGTPSFTIRATGASTYDGGLSTSDSGSIKMTKAMTGLTSANWHHIALVYDGYRMRTYVDGALYDTKTLTGGLQNRFCPMNIGHTGKDDYDWSTNTPLGFYDGYMDELRVYERALAASEVNAIYLNP